MPFWYTDCQKLPTSLPSALPPPPPVEKSWLRHSMKENLTWVDVYHQLLLSKHSQHNARCPMHLFTKLYTLKFVKLGNKHRRTGHGAGGGSCSPLEFFKYPFLGKRNRVYSGKNHLICVLAMKKYIRARHFSPPPPPPNESRPVRIWK